MKFFKLIFLCVLFLQMSCVNKKQMVSSQIITNNEIIPFPKVIIYDAPQLPITIQDYFNLGFTHISVYSVPEPNKIPNKNKYIVWTGIASNDVNAKWWTEKTPFNHDISQYKVRWNNRLDYYRKKYYNPSDKEKFGIMMLDIEAKKNDIQLQKEPPLQPGRTKAPAKAISEYKTEMTKLYKIPLDFAKQNYTYYDKWSSYGDVPIERNWWGIPKKTWKEWTTDLTNLNYITHKIVNGKALETDFSKSLDFYGVSCYYFYSPKYNVSKEIGLKTCAQYLAYMLFQLEVNQAWTQKDIYLFLSFLYQGERERNTLIDNTMVRNSVLFSLISGADGLVLYDDSRKPNADKEYNSLIKSFTDALSELKKYRDYFETNKKMTYFKPDNARDLFVYYKPIIRGIENNGKLLLAACNPYANDNETTKLSFIYKNKTVEIVLKGKNALLKEFDFSTNN